MKKAIFLDRDGVINEVMSERVKFVNKKKDLYLLEGVSEAISSLREKGYSIFVVTNQGGVGLGFMKEKELSDIHKHMEKLLISENKDALIDDLAACTHKPTAGCRCRKPLPGMILTLATKHQIDVTQSYMIGDMESDVESGKAAGVKTILLSPDNKIETKADMISSSLKEAASMIN